MSPKRMIGIAVAAVAFWALATPMKAYGQKNTWAGIDLKQMVDTARWRIGFMRVNAAFMLVNGGYDSDVFYGFLPDPVPDLTLTASTPIQVILPASKNLVFDIRDIPQYTFYLDLNNERAWNNSFQGLLHFAANRFYLQAQGYSASTRQRLSSELNVNIRQREDILNGLILWQVSRDISLALLYKEASYDLRNAEFEGIDLAETLNRKEDYLNTLIYYQPSSRIRFFVEGEYGNYIFKEAASSFKDARSYSLYGGIDFIPISEERKSASGIKGNIRLGHKRLDMVDPSQLDGSGFMGAVNLSAGVMKKTTVSLLFSRDFRFSIFAGATYYISMTYGGGISRLISRRISFAYDLSFGRTFYPKDESPSIIPVYSNRYTTHMASLNLRLSRDLGITVLGFAGKRVVDETGRIGNRSFLGFNLTYGSPPGGITAPERGSFR
jgi:hypothetical protein